jgi:protein-tyrosine phosphatase
MGMRSILFICSGNVFRSLVAEYALKALLPADAGYRVGSAGIEAIPQPVPPWILDRLREKGADATGHVPRRLTRVMLEEAALPVAMGLNHREFISREFRRDVPLFNEVCFQRLEPILDVGEAVPDWETNARASEDYALWVIDYIWSAMPTFLSKLN